MKKVQLFFLALILVFTACEEEPQLTFNGIKSKTAKHLGEGVWIDVPASYSKAKSYNGFQASGLESSISLQINEATIEDVKRSFDEKLLKRKKTKLITLQVVPFGTQDSAVFSMVHDRRKGTIRYLLSIKQGNMMYGVKAFCYEALKDKYDMRIKRALESVAFGEIIVKKEPFVLAKLVSLNEFVFTRDGEFPTQSEDGANIVLKIVDAKEVGNYRFNKTDYLKEALSEYYKGTISKINIKSVGEGHYISTIINKPDVKLFGAHISDGKEMSELYIGKSSTLEGVREISEFVRNSNLKTVIGTSR